MNAILRRTLPLAPVAALLLALAAAPALGADPRQLVPQDVVKAALAGDARVQGADWDLLAALAKAREAELRRLPSVSLSAGYTRLSDLPISFSLAGFTFSLPSMDNAWSAGVNLQYPVFAGFRLRESARLAQVQAQGKEIAAEMIRRALVFEAERAYWEALRASENVAMLRESLALAAQSQDLVSQQFTHGTAMRVDVLSAQARRDQATMDLQAAVNAQKRAFWNLAYLVDGTAQSPEGQSPAAQSPAAGAPGTQPPAAADPAAGYVAPYVLAVRPEPVADTRFTTLDEAQLISQALSNRPEIRAAGLSSAAADIGRRIAEAPLYPTLAVTGGLLYADPNPRVAFQSDPGLFTATWQVGVSLSYDLGGLPANLAARDAQADAAARSKSDEKRQREMVILDVESTLLAFQQARGDYLLVSGMIEQARENERVTAQRVAAGTANDLDQLASRIARLKIEFAISNKLIDQQIAAADLERAAALAPLP
ncbi:MAG TPA: TolC family protein [Spirochaetia bacterium]|nr:TolC family protein [Spirochaetia bacterium]